MKITDRLKQLIFKQLYRELGNAEIIRYEDSIWFINREEKYWYFEFENAGTLYWRYSFFPSFFTIFSLEREDFEPILASWVEEVLNHRVSTTMKKPFSLWLLVEEVLNHRVSTTCAFRHTTSSKLGDVLNSKVLRTDMDVFRNYNGVEEVLNHKVSTTGGYLSVSSIEVEDILNHKVTTTMDIIGTKTFMVEKVLNENPTE
jgi:hypothetical protein